MNETAMSDSIPNEHNDDVSRLALRIEATKEILGTGTSQAVLEILAARAEAARTAERDHLAYAIEIGLAAEALSRATGHGDVESAVRRASQLNLRVLRRYRAIARYVLEHPTALPMILATRSIRAAADLIKCLTEPVEDASPSPGTGPEADHGEEQPSMAAAVHHLLANAPALALAIAAAISADADRAEQVARVEMSMSPAAAAKCKAALGVVLAQVAILGSGAVAEMLAGAAAPPFVERDRDGGVRIPGTPAAEMGTVEVRIVATVEDADRACLAAAIANVSRRQAAAVNEVVAVARPVLTGLRAEIEVFGTTSAGRVEPDALVLYPFVAFLGYADDDGAHDSDATPRILRHGLVELRVKRQRLVLGMPSASTLSIMRQMNLKLSACGKDLCELATEVMEALADPTDPEIRDMFVALQARDWQFVSGAVPRSADGESVNHAFAGRRFGLTSPKRA